MRDLTAKLAARRQFADTYLAAHSALMLERERGNEHDDCAVRVAVDGKVVGYLENGLAMIVARELDRGRPVYASPIEGRQGQITLYLLEPGERRPGPRSHLVEVTSSDGRRSYVVDRRKGLCTCVAGRWVHCRHQRQAGAPSRSRPSRAVPAMSSAAASA
jgi:hypothetical protein